MNGLRYGFLGMGDVSHVKAAIAALVVAGTMFSICFVLFKRGYNIKT